MDAGQGHDAGAHRVGAPGSDKAALLHHACNPESQNGHLALLPQEHPQSEVHLKPAAQAAITF
jgi:hypothetical protein